MQTVRLDLEERYGVVDGQAVMAFAAFWEGCTYCSRGHLYASNLLRYRDTGVLLPLEAHDLLALRRLRDDEVLHALAHRLAEAPELLAVLQRQHALRSAGVPEAAADDPLLAASLAVWGWLSECSIMVADDPTPPPALHREANGDDALQRSYRAARAR